MKLVADTRTMAIGDPFIDVVATPPTLASAVKSATLIVPASDEGAVASVPAPAHAASAAAAAAYTPSDTNFLLSIRDISGLVLAPHAQPAPHPSSFMIASDI